MYVYICIYMYLHTGDTHVYMQTCVCDDVSCFIEARDTRWPSSDSQLRHVTQRPMQ